MKNLFLVFISFAIFGFYGCSEDVVQQTWTIDPNRINELLANSETQIVIDETTLELHVHLSRDFMPPVYDGTPLYCLSQLVATDSIAVPEDLFLEEQYVINGDSLWVAAYREASKLTTPYILEGVSLNGPKWQPGRTVTVVVKVRNLADNKVYYIRKENQVIGATA